MKITQKVIVILFNIYLMHSHDFVKFKYEILSNELAEKF